MKQPAQKIHASTQEFTEIANIIEDIALFTNGHAALILEVSATNFALLSKDEQDSRIGAYAAFLNSLTFPIQILAINKQVDISSYLTLLENQIETIQNNPHASDYMKSYKDFITQLVKQNTVLDKHFYVVIPYSSMEGGVSGVIANSADFFTNAKSALHAKADGIRAQLGRINLMTKVLEKEAILAVFAESYGQKR